MLSDDSWLLSPSPHDVVNATPILSCRGCLRGFSNIIRKHICKKCGKDYCGFCSSIKSVNNSCKLRICNDCGQSYINSNEERQKINSEVKMISMPGLSPSYFNGLDENYDHSNISDSIFINSDAKDYWYITPVRFSTKRESFREIPTVGSVLKRSSAKTRKTVSFTDEQKHFKNHTPDTLVTSNASEINNIKTPLNTVSSITEASYIAPKNVDLKMLVCVIMFYLFTISLARSFINSIISYILP